MATTSGNLTAGTATIGGSRQNGTGGRFGLRVRVAAGVATLGCAAALAIGGLGAGDTPPARSQMASAAPLVQASTIDERAQQWFLAQNQLPEGIVMIAATTYEQQWFLAQNQLPEGIVADPGCAYASAAVVPAEGCATTNALPTGESAAFHGNGYTER